MVRGDGVSVGLIDEGIDTTHPALALAHIQTGPDAPVPALHGTQVAALILGRGAEEGVPSAGAAGAQLILRPTSFAAPPDPAMVALALLSQGQVDVSNNSWGDPRAFGDNIRASGSQAVADAIAFAVTTGRDGLAEVAREIWTGVLSGEAARDRQEDC